VQQLIREEPPPTIKLTNHGVEDDRKDQPTQGVRDQCGVADSKPCQIETGTFLEGQRKRSHDKEQKKYRFK
jgi:hypothetical protein